MKLQFACKIIKLSVSVKFAYSVFIATQKNARIEELERQIKKMSQEKQDVTIASLQSTCEDLCCKITESLESFFCRNQNALTRLEVVQEKHDQLAVDQMKQYLQQNFQDQKEYMKSFLEG